MSLSTKVGDIILSSQNYDLYMSPEQSTANLKEFFERALMYKERLMNEFGCMARLEEVL
jgi:serine protease Do